MESLVTSSSLFGLTLIAASLLGCGTDSGSNARSNSGAAGASGQNDQGAGMSPTGGSQANPEAGQGGGAGSPQANLGGREAAASSSGGGLGGSTTESTSGGSGTEPAGGSTFVGTGSEATLNSLSVAEQNALCERVGEIYENAFFETGGNDLLCRFQAVFTAGFMAQMVEEPTSDAELQISCAAAYTECMNAEETEVTECGELSDECTATVNELETCARESGLALGEEFADIPACSELTMATIAEDASFDSLNETPSTAACDAMEAKCPEAL